MGTTMTVAFVDAARLAGRVRARRRLPRLPLARWGARADHDRPLPRRRARAYGRPDAGGGRAPSAAIGHHPCGRDGAGDRGGRVHGARRARRPHPASARTGSRTCCRRRDRRGHRRGRARTRRGRRRRSSTAANQHGGEDNISVVLFELVEGDPDAETGGRPSRRAEPSSRVRPAEPTSRSEERSEHTEPVPEGGCGDRLHRARGRRRSPRPLLGHQPVSARSRELAGLVVAALLAGIALASVTIARDAEISASAVTWAALFFALYVVAHVVVRRTVPYADGALLPLTAVLTAFGIAFDLPPRCHGRGPPGRLGRRRRRGARRDAHRAPPRLPRPRVVPLPLRRRGRRAAAASRRCRESASA